MTKINIQLPFPAWTFGDWIFWGFVVGLVIFFGVAIQNDIEKKEQLKDFEQKHEIAAAKLFTHCHQRGILAKADDTDIMILYTCDKSAIDNYIKEMK